MPDINVEVSDVQVYLAVIVFTITYLIIISEMINRAVIVLVGAVVMVFLGVVSIDQALTHHIEWGTIILLISMMILVGITNKTGVFQYVALKSAKLVRGEPRSILIILSLITALGSALLDNVTTVLLIVPITLSITRLLGVSPIPFLISEILFSNIGGAATLIGDPPNIMIGSEMKNLTFNAFIFNLGPIVLIIGLVTMILIYTIYYDQMRVSDSYKQKLMRLNEKDYIKNYPLMRKSLFVLGLTILGFAAHSIVHMDPAVVALAGATLLLLIGVKEQDMEEVFYSVEWGTIFFFAGLFTIVGGLVEVGVISNIAQEMLDLTEGHVPTAAILILWVSGIASAVIDNIPFVATMIPLIQEMSNGMGFNPDAPEMEVIWWALSLGACLGGNGSLLGASANVIVAGMATKEGNGLSYMDFLKIGAPLTLIALAISHAYLYFRYLV
ncbi:ArsB/NhaD family transporter [Bacillus sp. Marseille-P3661]|uniref:ArsB/NhaD family transporter n=1 Tax=Bacillus sp. Marseille-P3661 TaxID=1936234 RepID=UPI000C846C38|nr:ArsB/NhaD family transporter [Bacillus sp. Marseille-P3661]